MAPYLSYKSENKIRFYRIILLITGAAYMLFFLIYSYSPEISDPMNFWQRIFAIFIYGSTFFLTFYSNYLRIKIELITFILAFFSVLQLFYYNFHYQFNIEIAIVLIAVTAIFNLIFSLNNIKFFINIVFFITLSYSLYLVENPHINKLLYLNSYFLIAALSFYISYYFEEYESKLAENLNEKQIVFDTLDIQIWYLKDSQNYGMANQAHADFLGVEQNKIINSKISDFFDYKKEKKFKFDNEEIFKEKKKIQKEKWIKNAEGEKRLLRITKNPKLNSKANIEYVVCSAEDITEKYQAKQKVEKQKNRLKWVLESINAGIYEWDIPTAKISFNKKWAELLGYPVKKLKTTDIESWREITHPGDLKRAQNKLKKHFEQQKDYYEAEIRMKNNNGDWIWFSDRGRVISRSKTEWNSSRY